MKGIVIVVNLNKTVMEVKPEKRGCHSRLIRNDFLQNGVHNLFELRARGLVVSGEKTVVPSGYPSTASPLEVEAGVSVGS